MIFFSKKEHKDPSPTTLVFLIEVQDILIFFPTIFVPGHPLLKTGRQLIFEYSHPRTIIQVTLSLFS